ncbi:MAG: hypothetical protein GSR85_02615 [Desulfurococcales archaeon]|nr:hypothetical protein [Desulfurococcales archaeon]
MAKRQKAKRRKKRCHHPCDCGWRVNWTREFRLAAREMGLWGDVKMELRDLEKRLRSPDTRDDVLAWLESQYSPYEVVYKRRRFPGHRIYVGRQTARAVYVIRKDICRVWFTALVPVRKKYRHRTIRS